MKKFPLVLVLTYRCNQRCKFCISGKKHERSPDIELDEIEKLLEEYHTRISDVFLLGGEPTLYPHLKELMEMLSKYNLNNIMLTSNGHSLDDKQWVSYLIEHNTNQFLLSFHDIDQDILSVQTGNKNNFRNVNKAISNILSLGGEISTNCVITKLNYTRIKEIGEYLYSKGVRKINYIFVMPPVNIEYDFDNLIPTYTEVYPYLEEALDYLKEKKVVSLLQYFPQCTLKKYEDNKIYDYAGGYYYKDYNHEYFRKNDGTDYLFEKAETCKFCKYNDKCLGVSKDYVDKVGWDEFKPVVA